MKRKLEKNLRLERMVIIVTVKPKASRGNRPDANECATHDALIYALKQFVRSWHHTHAGRQAAYRGGRSLATNTLPECSDVMIILCVCWVRRGSSEEDVRRNHSRRTCVWQENASLRVCADQSMHNAFETVDALWHRVHIWQRSVDSVEQTVNHNKWLDRWW